MVQVSKLKMKVRVKPLEIHLKKFQLSEFLELLILAMILNLMLLFKHCLQFRTLENFIKEDNIKVFS